MNFWYLVLFGPVILFLAACVYLFRWFATAPFVAAEHVRDRR